MPLLIAQQKFCSHQQCWLLDKVSSYSHHREVQRSNSSGQRLFAIARSPFLDVTELVNMDAHSQITGCDSGGALLDLINP